MKDFYDRVTGAGEVGLVKGRMVRLNATDYGAVVMFGGRKLFAGVWSMEALCGDGLAWAEAVQVTVQREAGRLVVIVPSGFAHDVETFGGDYRFTLLRFIRGGGL